MQLRTSVDVWTLANHLLNRRVKPSENTDSKTVSADEDLSFRSLFGKGGDCSVERLLPTGPNEFFDGKCDIFEKEKTIFEKYRDARVKPYFTTRDFGYKSSPDGRSKQVFGSEIGISISF